MRTRRQKIETVKQLATQPPAILTQVHADLLNEYSKGKGEPHKPGHLDNKYIATIVFYSEDERQEFSGRWDELPELPDETVLICINILPPRKKEIEPLNN